MKPFIKQGKSFFPKGQTIAMSVPFLGYLQCIRKSSVYQVIEKDFDKRQIKAVNIEDKKDFITLDFRQPVNSLITV
jgi:hypothetical protein